MFFEKDYLVRQIKLLGDFVSKALFGKNNLTYEILDDENLNNSDLLYLELIKLIKNNEFSNAEDFLFENFDKSNKNHLKIAIIFYKMLNEISTETLTANNFSREEIDEGFREILKICNINPDIL